MKRAWFDDGPNVPADFSRQSVDGRLTLVLDAEHLPVRSLWAVLDCRTVTQAVEALRVRERIPRDRPECVGRWLRGDPAPDLIPDLVEWADRRGAAAVVWTGLPSRFGERDGVKPSPSQAVEYLKNLEGAMLGRARHYVEMAPRQVDTTIRRQVEVELGWRRSE